MVADKWPALFLLAAAGCGDTVTGPFDEITQLPRALSAAEVEVINASNRFAFGLLAQANRPGRGRQLRVDPAAVIPDVVVMYLINAIYFKGSWTFQFDPSDTRPEPFRLDDGSTRTVSLMSLETSLPYQEAGQFQAVDLPYGGRAFSMTVLLPQHGVTVDDLAATLDAAAWEDIAGGFQETDLLLFLPRFRMPYERTLNDDLAALGMVDAFDQRADLSRLSPVGGLFISEVKQKSWVEVNEEGTEAAAATAVTAATSAGPVVRADRPFLFLIRERLSGTILFAGKFARPVES